MRYLVFAFGVIGGSVAALDEAEVLRIADGLGAIIASEEFCGLVFDSTAISDWMSSTVPAGHLGFAGMLQASVESYGYLQDEMSETARAAHCAAVRATAAHYGFVSD